MKTVYRGWILSPQREVSELLPELGIVVGDVVRDGNLLRCLDCTLTSEQMRRLELYEGIFMWELEATLVPENSNG